MMTEAFILMLAYGPKVPQSGQHGQETVSKLRRWDEAILAGLPLLSTQFLGKASTSAWPC